VRLHQRIRRDQGRHTDDWLITYADTITLLLCLFVIILSIESTGGNHTPDAVQSVDHATESRNIFEGQPPFHGLARTLDGEADETPIKNPDDAAIPGGEAPWGMSSETADTAPDIGGVLVGQTSEPPRRTEEAVGPPVSVVRGTISSPETAAIAASSLPAVLDRIKSQASADVEQQGNRITTVQINSAAFFDSGYALLSGAGKSILRDVAVTLKSPEFAGYRISIEGHTDDNPINTAQFQSNWELSTARAAAVVRFFLEQGIPARQLSAAGYADSFPLAPNRTAEGTVIPDNQARNRRVVIKLEKIDKVDR
jgi:chemotaxis protein MotB